MRYRLLALDIDGTLLDPAGRVCEAAREAVAEARGAGLRIVLCTGRRYRTAIPVAQELGLAGPIVVHNGAVVKDTATGRTLAARYLSAELYPDALAALRPQGPPLVYVDGWPGEDILAEPERGAHPHQLDYLARHAEHCRLVPDLVAAAREDVIMLSVMADAETIARVRRDVVAALGARIRTHSLENTTTGGQILELLAPDTGKWRALRRLAEASGIAPGEIASVGDDLNDLELVSEAGLGIAMGNAAPAVAAAADLVVASNERGGAAQAIETVLRAR